MNTRSKLQTDSRGSRCWLPHLVHHLAQRVTSFPFCRTLQNELTPNHANVTVKQIAITTRPTPIRPASYFAYSFAAANPPLAAITRKINPVTSSHN